MDIRDLKSAMLDEVMGMLDIEDMAECVNAVFGALIDYEALLIRLEENADGTKTNVHKKSDR